jgi:DNA repair exonuclease SbcCD ATPase subunit
VKQAEAAAEAIPHDATAPEAEVSVRDLMAELQRRRDANQQNAVIQKNLTDQQKRLDGIVGQAERLKTDIEEMERSLDALRADLVDKQATITKGTAWIASETERVLALQDADTAAVEQQIADSESINSKVRSNRQRQQMLSEAGKIKATSADLTQRIEAIDAAKAHAMSEAKWPIAGLGFDDSGVILNDLPLAQASSAEQLRVSVAIGLALNPNLRVLLIRDGSLLDPDSMAAIAKQSQEAAAQVWIERVSDGAECSVVISDGQVVW